ncbi:MAG: anti-sigma-factor antagonist [Cyanobacteria bacterium RYN_339]|nr:anti-sigma-factor antagonist [Cyanobacteria bacterium RYN_339]
MITLNQRPVANAHVLTVAGKIDARTMGDFEDGIRALIDGGHFNVVIDFAEVPFISSAGLGILMSVIEEIRDAGGDLVLACVVPEVYRIFDLLEFTTLFQFFPTVDEAIAAFAGQGA